MTTLKDFPKLHRHIEDQTSVSYYYDVDEVNEWKKEFEKEVRERFEFEEKEAKGYGHLRLVLQHMQKRILGK